MGNPDETPDEDAREANLATITDDQWLEGHARLTEAGGVPEEELTFVWDPDLDPASLLDPAEVEEAPRG